MHYIPEGVTDVQTTIIEMAHHLGCSTSPRDDWTFHLHIPYTLDMVTRYRIEDSFRNTFYAVNLITFNEDEILFSVTTY